MVCKITNVKRASIREQSDRTVVVFPSPPGVASPSFNFNLPLTHRKLLAPKKEGGKVPMAQGVRDAHEGRTKEPAALTWCSSADKH